MIGEGAGGVGARRFPSLMAFRRICSYSRVSALGGLGGCGVSGSMVRRVSTVGVLVLVLGYGGDGSAAEEGRDSCSLCSLERS